MCNHVHVQQYFTDEEAIRINYGLLEVCVHFCTWLCSWVLAGYARACMSSRWN